MVKEKVILAYSGGLDTSVAITYAPSQLAALLATLARHGPISFLPCTCLFRN